MSDRPEELALASLFWDAPSALDPRSQSPSGIRICKRITQHYAKTFYFASHCLPRATRIHAYAVYGFCRSADNAIDDARDKADALERLNRARDALDRVYGRGLVPPGLQSLRWTVRMRRIPRRLFLDLLDGMEMDLTISRYADFPALETYCYRVAGVVGLMMTRIFGFRHERCFANAIALGNAMQLTNIARDVGEDWGMGRVYLPEDEMERFGVSEAGLAEGRVDDGFRDLMRLQIARARRYYGEAGDGVSDLIGASSRLTVRVMGRLYGGILDEIEKLDYDVFRTRARVSTPRKLALLADCLIRPRGGAKR